MPRVGFIRSNSASPVRLQLYQIFPGRSLRSLRHEFNGLPDGHEQIMIALPA